MSKTKKKKQKPVQKKEDTKDTKSEVKKEVKIEQVSQILKDDIIKIEFSNQQFFQNTFPNFSDSKQGQDKRIQVFERVDISKEDFERIINENQKLKKENGELINEMKKYCQLYEDLTRRATNQDKNS
jgi:hypothetical protein